MREPSTSIKSIPWAHDTATVITVVEPLEIKEVHRTTVVQVNDPKHRDTEEILVLSQRFTSMRMLISNISRCDETSPYTTGAIFSTDRYAIQEALSTLRNGKFLHQRQANRCRCCQQPLVG